MIDYGADPYFMWKHSPSANLSVFAELRGKYQELLPHMPDPPVGQPFYQDAWGLMDDIEHPQWGSPDKLRSRVSPGGFLHSVADDVLFFTPDNHQPVTVKNLIDDIAKNGANARRPSKLAMMFNAMYEANPAAGLYPDLEPPPVAPNRAAIKKMIPNESLVKQVGKFGSKWGGRALKLAARLPK